MREQAQEAVVVLGIQCNIRLDKNCE